MSKDKGYGSIYQFVMMIMSIYVQTENSHYILSWTAFDYVEDPAET